MFKPYNLIGAPNLDIWLSTTDQRFALGQRIEGYDETFGWGEFIYCKLASSTMAPGRLVTWDGAFAITDNPNTANLGQPLGVLKTKMDASSAVCYGWVQRAGIAPVQSATVAATGAAYFSAAGTVTTTLTAGKQILNAKILQIPTYAITKQAKTVNGSPRVIVPSLDGIFPGMALSGTGLSGTVLSLESGSNNAFTASANASASGTVTASFTYTGFGQMLFDRPTSQGIIT